MATAADSPDPSNKQQPEVADEVEIIDQIIAKPIAGPSRGQNCHTLENDKDRAVIDLTKPDDRAQVKRDLAAGPPKELVLIGEDARLDLMRQMDTTLLTKCMTASKGWGNDDFIEAQVNQYPNTFAKRVSHILDKIERGKPVSPEEANLVNSKKGYLLAHQIHQFEKIRKAELSITATSMDEYCDEEFTGANWCKNCDMGHGSSIWLNQCNEDDRFGPRHMPWMEEVGNMSDVYDAVFMGISAFLFLPSNIGSKILNLGARRLMDYNIGISFNYDISTGPGTFANELWRRLVVTGLKKKLPFLVEFFLSPTADKLEWRTHLFGFMRVIMHVQPYYKGKIIVVMPPFEPKPHCAQSDYHRGKMLTMKLNRYAKTIGLLVGVAVWEPKVQTFSLDNDSWLFRQKNWHQEYLYNVNGGQCRELRRRIGTEMETLLKYMKEVGYDYC